MVDVEVVNRSGVELDVDAAVGLAREGLAAEGIDEGELWLTLVNADEIRVLKREHLGVDEPTDDPSHRRRRGSGEPLRGVGGIVPRGPCRVERHDDGRVRRDRLAQAAPLPLVGDRARGIHDHRIDPLLELDEECAIAEWPDDHPK